MVFKLYVFKLPYEYDYKASINSYEESFNLI